jgi:glutathione synthase/RimK-type ligase-like ATP-grasp enzyme
MILVVSYPGDDHTDRVVARLEADGREVVAVDLGDFPAGAGLTLSYGPPAAGGASGGAAGGAAGGADGPVGPGYRLDGLGGAFDPARARVGWWRRVRPFTAAATVQDPQDRAFALSETSQAVLGLLDALPCTWVNPPGLDEAAHRKTLQWAVAAEVGLTLPRTLVTNVPDEARAFVADVGLGKVVFKAFLASVEAWRETRLVRAAELAQLDSVRLAPVIFQEYVAGPDLRVTVVGDEMLAAEIDATASPYPVDMRMVVGESTVRPVELPVDVAGALRALMDRLGLVYGAVDLRRTPEGRHVFFEVNPAGQWLFVEERTGLPITQRVADLLARLDDGELARPPGRVTQGAWPPTRRTRSG